MKLIFPILFILLSIITFIFGTNKFYKDVSALRSDISTYNLAIDNSNDLKSKEDALLTTYNEIKQEDKDRLGNFLPSTVNNIQFILEVERIANLHGMPIKDIKFENKKKDVPVDPNVIIAEENIDRRPYGVFPVEFTTEGKYEAFILFLKDLEYNLRLVDVKSVSFEVSDKPVVGADPSVYTYSLKVETYWLK
ncbi:TPA: hypothetical protein DEP30_01245 [Candidatus Nomurabacteria bacterium]|nr:MAG: hypothetical protein UR97_C0002G0094 [Candidatus Nomurabacteria bacterium GW2011_GWE2_36_115]KKP94499.1 MAG: hypothetical protein US00_C0001G0093 [Candidatus Nomurabacteria bacterium GW2011_GWF2_36_126]KKP96961.1 MAG: hypothetical protein US04_C0001G0464 [Candidatus Nomurabacteria bacterium GW2011_GWD2_36_14]KKP99435.1 MAG: hypothetical protein US08_C0001G0117 [Candidatus Nomurabacteria bacterium GW2011_GWF2_36_19]KKQ05709.1 MAG: hypothetical protein US17_C0002G0093 [Candidatus Nomuraba